MITGIDKRASLMLAVMAAAVTGCATLRGQGGPNPEAELARGVAALRAQDYNAARAILEPLYRAHYMDGTGERALLVLTAAELDPRNAGRRLYAASDFASMLLNAKAASPWEVAVAETMYLLSQELGAHEEQLERAEAAKQQAQQGAADAQRQLTTPTSTRESWPLQLKKVRDDRDALAKRVEQLQQTLKSKEKDLTEATAELERIKKTLKIK